MAWHCSARHDLGPALFAGHTHAVRGVSVTRNGDAAVSCSTDCTVRLWRVPYAPFESGSVEAEDRAVLQFHGNAAFKYALLR